MKYWDVELKGKGQPVDLEELLPLERGKVYGMQVPPQDNGVKLRNGLRSEDKPDLLDYTNSLHVAPREFGDEPRTQIIFLVDERIRVWVQSAGRSGGLPAKAYVYPYNLELFGEAEEESR